MSKDLTKSVAEEFVKKVWNGKDIGLIDKLVHKDALIHSLLGDFHGKEGMKDVIKLWIKGFPDLVMENEFAITENDLVCFKWSSKATHKGEFKGKMPTNKQVTFKGISIYRVFEGQIIQYWASLDMHHLLSQIE